VTRKLEDEETIRDTPTYCHGMARLIFLQSLERLSSMENWFSVDEYSRLRRTNFFRGIV
jgi:hypothetical protein